jgi:RNA polymerase sigma-70 factor (ECF subfamily)
LSLFSNEKDPDEKRTGRNSYDETLDLVSVQKSLQGDKQAFNSIVERYTPLLYSLAYRMLGNSEEAEDAVQEIFFRIYYSLGRFHLSERFFSWIYTIAINWLRSYLRKNQRRKVKIEVERRELLNVLKQQQLVNDPCQQIIRQDVQRIVQKAVGALKPLYREVFVLHYFEELPVIEIANLLKMPEGTVKIRLYRARNILLKYLKLLKLDETKLS